MPAPIRHRRPFRHKAGSPRVRTRSFIARSPHLRRLSLDRNSFAVICPLAVLDVALYAILVHRPAIYAPRFLPTTGCPYRSCASLHSLRSACGGTFTLRNAPVPGAQKEAGLYRYYRYSPAYFTLTRPNSLLSREFCWWRRGTTGGTLD